MKRIICMLSFLLVLMSLGFSQEVNTAFENTLLNEALDIKILLHTGINPYTYRFYDDTQKISEINLYSILKTVPQNKGIIQNAITWRIVSIITSGLVGGFSGVMLVKHHTGSLTREGTIFFSSGIVTCGITSILSGSLFRCNLDKAVDNYNLSVMGIPIK